MKLCYNEATGKNCSTLEQDLEICEKVGFDYIEIRLDMLEQYLKKHTVEDLKRFFDTHRLKPHAFNALYIYNEMLSGSRNPNPQRERQIMKDFMFACEVGKKIGDHYFVVVPDLYRDAPNTKPYMNTRGNILIDSVRILTELSDIAKDYEMNLAFEPVGSLGCAVKTVEQAWEIVCAVNRENVGLAMDCFNLHLHGKLNDFAVMKMVNPDKIFVVHINNVDDVPLGIMGNQHRRFCDAGGIDLKSYLGTLYEMHYGGMVSVETFRPEYWEMDIADVIQKAYQTTRETIEKYGFLDYNSPML